jgi:hypothetical protein
MFLHKIGLNARRYKKSFQQHNFFSCRANKFAKAGAIQIVASPAYRSRHCEGEARSNLV